MARREVLLLLLVPLVAVPFLAPGTPECTPVPITQPSLCGDGVIAGIEECDGDELAGSSCAEFGFDGGELGCDDSCQFDTSGCVTWGCGNGAIEGDEVCDGDDLANASCETQGFDAGTLACDANCQLDTSGCVTWQCGNGTAEGDEECDGDDLRRATCESRGFAGGNLSRS